MKRTLSSLLSRARTLTGIVNDDAVRPRLQEPLAAQQIIRLQDFVIKLY